MKSSEMLSLITGKDGKVIDNVKDLTKALEKMKKVEKAEGLKRRTEAARRKQFGDVGVSVKLSYDAMTSFVWEFAMNHMDELRTWMQCQYPDKFATVPGEIQDGAMDASYKGRVEAQG